MLYFTLPDTDDIRHINFNLLQLMENAPELFNNNYKINGVYGTLINSYMDGGRNIQSKISPLIADKIVQDYKHFNVNYSHVLSAYYDFFNSNDIFLNQILNLANKYGNNVIISDLKLNNYIKSSYPNITRIASAVRLDSLEMSLDFLEKRIFDKIVLQTKYNSSLNLIPDQFKNKIIILPNDCCPSDCPLKKPCYERTFSLNINEDLNHLKWGNWDVKGIIPCKNQKKLNSFKQATTWFEQSVEIPNQYQGAISLEEINKNDFSYVKLEGRRKPDIDLAYLYASTFAKNPENIVKIMYDLLKGPYIFY